jgi:CRISPR-associated protein Cmr6
MYSGTKLVDALVKQHQKRSNSELFKSGEFILDWRSKVGSFPHPDGETLVSAGEPCGSWRTVTLTKREKDSNGKWQDKKYQSRPEDKRNLDHNLESLAILPLNGYVPAASIRGIVRAWVSQHPDLIRRMKELLGYQDGSKIIAGKIEFLDAFPIEATKLTLDIVNPQQDFQVFHTGSASPLSLYTLGDGRKKVEIKVAIRGCRGADADDVDTVWEWVQQALSTHGVGSRTASGYGALTAPIGYQPKPELSKLKEGCASKTLGFTLYSQGCGGINPKVSDELRPTHWRGWLRSWVLRFLLGVMSRDNAELTANELFGSLNQKGLVRLQVRIHTPDLSRDRPIFYRWKGTLELTAPEDILNEIILPVIKIAVRVSGVGKGWRRPLHIVNGWSRGCHVELTRSLTDVTNSTPSKLDLAGNDLNLIYDVWKDAAIKNWHDRYQENLPSIEAEVFSPASCAVYKVSGTAQNPIDIKTLTWIDKEPKGNRGKGMELIYDDNYKRKSDVGGNIKDREHPKSNCSWVSIKRVNGAKPEDRCQEIVCIFMGNNRQLRSQFLADLAKIPGAVHLFGRQPN